MQSKIKTLSNYIITYEKIIVNFYRKKKKT